MGFTFRKSIRLPGGIRLNIGKSGVGASIGVPGFRVGYGPSGGKATVGLPGTGLGYTHQFARKPRAARAERESLDARAAALATTNTTNTTNTTTNTPERARWEVDSFNNNISVLTSLHRECGPVWRWSEIAAAPPPLPGDPTEGPRGQWLQRVAQGITEGNLDACRAAIDYLGPFSELASLGSTPNVAMRHPWCVEAWFTANPDSVVPSEQLSLTPTGKLSRRAMPRARANAIYQDHVCSASLRIAREVFALLPVPVVFVHTAMSQLDRSTGHSAVVPVLSVMFERGPFEALNLDAIDPSSAVEGFEHTMVFKKTTGLSKVELLTPEMFNVEE